MNEERKTEEFEDDRKKWKIYFDIEKRGWFKFIKKPITGYRL